MSPRRLLPLLGVLAALALAACGASSSGPTNAPVHSTAHAVVGFAAHAGLAFGAFKLFIEDPYREGKLSLHHPFTLAKAVAGALFAYHEIKAARSELTGHPALSRLASSFLLLEGTLHLLRGALEHGSTGSVGTAQSEIGRASSQAAGAGSPISTITSGIHL